MQHVEASVLIVDNLKRTTDFLVEELGAAEPRWTFVVSKSMSAALDEIQKRLKTSQPVAVVITDLDLKEPGHSGFELIKAVQQIDPFAMTILYTGHQQLLKQYDTSGLGAFDVVVKGEKGDVVERILEKTRTAINGGAIIDHRTPRKRRFVAVQK
jgi:DNA-binding NtrC family response regulator